MTGAVRRVVDLALGLAFLALTAVMTAAVHLFKIGAPNDE
jgi:hypothetical protein